MNEAKELAPCNPYCFAPMLQLLIDHVKTPQVYLINSAPPCGQQGRLEDLQIREMHNQALIHWEFKSSSFHILCVWKGSSCSSQ